jgi:hypothetical protein
MFKDASSNAGLPGSVRWETPVPPKNIGLKVHRARRAARGKNRRKTRQVEVAAPALALILPLLLPEVHRAAEAKPRMHASDRAAGINSQ